MDRVIVDSFCRTWANSIPKPFALHYNPYTQIVETLDRKDQVLKLIEDVRSELDHVSTALLKQQQWVYCFLQTLQYNWYNGTLLWTITEAHCFFVFILLNFLIFSSIKSPVQTQIYWWNPVISRVYNWRIYWLFLLFQYTSIR